MSSLMQVFVVCIFWLLSASFAVAQTADVDAGDSTFIALMPGQDAASMAPHLRFSAVTKVSLNPEEILRQEMSLIPLGSDVLQFGPPNGPLLVRFGLQNNGDVDASWILFTGRGSLRDIRIWRLDDDPQLLLNGADRNALASNLRTYQAFSAEIALTPGERAELAILFEATDSTYFPLKVQTFQSFFSDRRSNIAMVSAVVSGVLMLIILNIVFFTITEKREFIWLGLAELAFALNTLHAEGYTTIFLFFDHPLLGLAFGDVIKCAFAIFMAQFARIFVSTKMKFPRVDIILRCVIYAGAAIMITHLGTAFWPENFRSFLFYAAWLVAMASAFFLPFVGIIATRQLGREYWPLILAWGSLAIYVSYAAIASSGIIPGLPVMWHLAGPVGLFEAVMATFALGLHIRAIQSEKIALDGQLTDSLRERLKISERAVNMERDRASALASLSDQNSLLHASGHDMRQVVSVIQSAAGAIKRDREGQDLKNLPELLNASAGYLEEIAITSMSAAVPGASSEGMIALSGLEFSSILKPIERIYRQICRDAKLDFSVTSNESIFIVTDRALVLRALSNILSNAVKFSETGGRVELSTRRENDVLHIEISDRGRGVTEALADKLNSDAALGAREHDDVAGTGWGFAQSRAMMIRLGGTLGIAPRQGGGACVTLTIPKVFETFEPCSFKAFQEVLTQSGSNLILSDGDNEDVSQVSDAAKIFAIYDDTAQGRARIARRHAHATLLIRPLCKEMAVHPCLSPNQDILNQA